MPTSNNPTIQSDTTRRALIASGAVGASGLLAGCSGGDGGGPTEQGTTSGSTETAAGTPTDATGTQSPTETQGSLPHVEGQTLNWYTMQNPADFTWWSTGVWPGTSGGYVGGRAGVHWTLTMQRSVWGPWIDHPAKFPPTDIVKHETVEDLSFSPTEVTVKIRDNATWSNGHDVTPEDAIGLTLAYRLHPTRPPVEEAEEEVVATPFDRLTDYEIVDSDTYKFISAPGGWEGMPLNMWVAHFLNNQWHYSGFHQDTELDPYKKWWDTVSGYWDMAKNGEIEPWGGDFNIMDEIRKDILGPRGWSSNPEKDNYDNYFEKFFQKPENVATVGAWTLGSINGTQSVTLVPNEEHYASDKVNFDEVKITSRPSKRANRSALKANTQDYYAGTIPDYIVQSFPDDIEQRLVPGGAGLAFGLDHDSKLFKKRKVRQAIMYALDRERAAKAVHRTKYTPISTPGGHPVNAARLLGEDWVSNNLQSYDRDLDKASQLMQEAGFAKSGGKWTDADGNVLSIQIPTAKGTPTLEPTIANQLSQFGFDASLQTYSGSVYQEKKQNGEFNIWPTSAGASSFVNRMLTLWFYIAGRRTNAEYWGVIPDEDIKDEWGDTSGFPPGKPSERLKGLTVQAPPIGEPEGELKTWEPPHLTQLAVIQSTDKENYIKWSRQLVWIINWLLPIIPIARGGKQHFLDTGHWNWPATDSEIGGSLGVGPEFEAPVSYGQYVSANPDNPEEGASVQE